MADSKIAGCLYGMAFGDALGAETEFLDMDRITMQFPPLGPQEPAGDPARVTDDTQMALAVGETLIDAPRPFEPESLAQLLGMGFIKWYHHPDNDRAPGRTCLNSIEKLIEGQDWHDASDISSKGCGANMRVQPVGLLPVDPTTRAGIAQLQAALTHGHPTALAAADMTAYVVAELLNGADPMDLPRSTREYAISQRRTYHEDWLGRLWYRAYMMPTPEAYISHGWDECLKILDRVDAAVDKMDRYSDPCLATGAGWIAEEAFATALFCFLMFPEDPVAVIQRSAATSGDSDSIASIAGAFAGVYKGIDSWPEDWLRRIEYHDRLAALAEALTDMGKASVE